MNGSLTHSEGQSSEPGLAGWFLGASQVSTFLPSEAVTTGSAPHQGRSFPTIFGTVSCVIFEALFPITKRNGGYR